MLEKIKSKIRVLSRKQKIIAGLVTLFIFSALLASGFLVFRKITTVIPSENLTKTLPKQNLGKDLSLEKTISVEKAAEPDKYQPTLKLNLSKPQGQPFNPHSKILLKLPKKFAQSTDQLSFVIPPTEVLEKDPLIVWDFSDLIDKNYTPDQICVTYILPYEDRKEFCHNVDLDEYEQFKKGEGEKVYNKVLEETEKELVEASGPDINLDKWEAIVSSSTQEERNQLVKEEEAKKLAQQAKSEEIAYNRYYEEIYEQRDRAIKEALDNFYGSLGDTVWQWLTGVQEFLEIQIKREPMDYQSAQKIYTETVTQLSGQAPPSEKNNEQPATGQNQTPIPTASLEGEKTLVRPEVIPSPVVEASPTVESGKITTMADFAKIADNCLGSQEGTIVMKLKITEEYVLALPGYGYEGQDETGSVSVGTYNENKLLDVGKTYELKGCKSNIGGGPGPGMPIFIIREELPGAIVEK